MKTVAVLIGHCALDAAFGWAVLSFRQHQRNLSETLLSGILLGMYVETLSVAALMVLGLELSMAGAATLVVMAATVLVVFLRNSQPVPRFSLPRLKWYEWAVLAAVSEKILFAIWQLARLHTYFDDALMHWSGRARSLYGGVNWSWGAASAFFLGKQFGNGNYPLLTVVWRALSAKLNGEWNEVISRADGLIFFIVIVGTVWAAVWRFSNIRWLPAAAAFIVSAVPLEAWHAAAGYSDIAVEAFVVAAAAALFRGEWMISGIMAAGAVWCKNDSLAVYAPALFLAVLIMQMQPENRTAKWLNVALFLAGFGTILPWLAFNYVHSLGITPGTQTLAWHSDALQLLWRAVISSSTSGVLWLYILPALVYFSAGMFKDKIGRALIGMFSASFGAIVFIFAGTSAYQFLLSEITIHRTLMQFSATAILITTYGFWLNVRPEASPSLRKKARPTRKPAA